MPDSSFKNQKGLTVEVCLGTDESTGPKTFNNEGADKLIITDNRVSLRVTNAGLGQHATMNCRIYGLAEKTMNAMTALKMNGDRRISNSIVVYAVDGTSKSLVFAGNMITAWPDYSGMPDVNIDVYAENSYLSRIQPQTSLSFPDESDVATIMSKLAKLMGRAFEGNGVNVKVRDLVLVGSYYEMAEALAKQAGVNINYDNVNVLAIWPKEGNRAQYITEIGPSSGLVGYPTYDGSGVQTRVFYNPELVVGGAIDIKTDVIGAKGLFYIQSVTHTLDAKVYGGAWFSDIRANRLPSTATL